MSAHRVGRHRPIRGLAILLVSVALALAACGGGSEGAVITGAPSQSPTDAARDGVIAEVAALPMEVRVEAIASLRAEEGIWVITRPTEEAAADVEGCRLGDPLGQYPQEVICTTEYGEVLLLDETGTQILRAFPLPAVPAEMLQITDDAVFCGRTGEGMLPDSMMCRIDRGSLEATVRVFPDQSSSVVVQPCYYPLPGWSVAPVYLEIEEVLIDAQGVWTRAGSGEWTQLTLETLEIVEAGLSRPGVSTTTTLVDSATETTGVPDSSTSAPVTTGGLVTTTETPTTGAAPGTAPTSVPALASELRAGDEGVEVGQLQERLLELGYWIDGVTDAYGEQTLHAVTALQKVAGLDRTGVFDSATRDALEAGTRPVAQSTSGRVIEISLDDQILMIVQDGTVEQIFDTSTGRATFPTPAGRYTIEKEVDGWHNAGLGSVYRPKYFHDGLSIHAYVEVPAFPASHGCSRVLEPAVNWIWDHGNVPVGTPVWIY